MPVSDTVLSWVHFGDLHITQADEQNHRDFLALIDKANRYLAQRVSFAVLPGDNADDGAEAQFGLVRDAIAKLSIPLHTLPGDHDYHTRSLEAFHTILGASPLPKSIVADGHCCLFLDIVSAGSGGPDFRLDKSQPERTATELERANAADQGALVFMHAYPADLHAGADGLRSLLERHRVVCVDMGHTHYNELANSGRTIFMATRSTGQIEEGPVGFSVAAVDSGAVSWRFAPLAAEGPLVLITSPSDHRLIIDPGSPDQVVHETPRIGAKVWAVERPSRVFARIDGGEPIELAPDAADPSLWRGSRDVRDLSSGRHSLTVEALGSGGAAGRDSIVFFAGRKGLYAPPPRAGDGSDRDSIGAWPEKGILGTQLGPNRNGRKW